jgi:hypothetical protein
MKKELKKADPFIETSQGIIEENPSILEYIEMGDG